MKSILLHCKKRNFIDFLNRFFTNFLKYNQNRKITAKDLFSRTNVQVKQWKM